MANVIKTLTAGDITRKALSILHNKLVFVKTINKQYDDRFGRTGAKNGGVLQIREPNQFTVRTGAVMDTQDVSETTQALTVATQKGVDINFSSVELTLSLDDFADRILDPAMARLAADVEATIITALYKDVYNLSGTPATTPASLLAVLNARTKINQGLAPKDSNRHILFDSIAMAATIDTLKTLFHTGSEIERMYNMGMMGKAGGFTFWESEMIPTHTNGSRVDASCVTTITGTVTVPTGGFVNGTASIVLSGGNNAKTFLAGDIFTIADVYAVNPETKQRYSHLQQWVVTTANTSDASGNVTLAVSPTPQATGAKQNISIASIGAKAVVHVAAGGSGTQDAIYSQPLAYHRDAFTFVTADLEMPKGVDFAAREQYDGISLRIVRDFDIVNDKFPCRIDVLYGYKAIMPGWACRVRG